MNKIQISRKCFNKKKKKAHCNSEAEKLNKVCRNRKIYSETKKKVLSFYVISIVLYGSECWEITSQMKKRLIAKEMRLYRRMLKNTMN